MASTNKTTHYELSQYVANDKPTYLTDYNGDMSAIDTGIYNAQQKADSAYSLADTADGKADNAQTTANTAVTNAGTANTNIGTMANLETTDKTSLVNAINEVNNLFNKFNLTSFTSYSSSDVQTTNNAVVSTGSITVATNSDGSIGKIYGRFDINANNVPSSSGYNIVIPNTSLRPSSQLVISSDGIVFIDSSDSTRRVFEQGLIIDTNGTITLPFFKSANENFARVILTPSLLFMQDFGDTPIE